jgi:type II secretory pathway component PulF
MVRDALRASSAPDLDAAAEALTALASLVASGYSLTAAVAEWHEAAPSRCHPDVAYIQQRMLFGSPTVESEESSASLLRPVVTAALQADRASASASVAILRAGADSLRSRAAEMAEATATTSGARLSGRMVAGLPLAFLVLTPLGGAPVFDALGVATVIAGSAFIATGIRWMSRMTPRPAEPSAVSRAVTQLATLLRSGVPGDTALAALAEQVDWEPLHFAARSCRLGLSWTDGLQASNDPHARDLARILVAGRRVGAGTVEALTRFSFELAAADRRRFETRLRRAPVLMVVPLVLCVLPGFALLTLGPFLRNVLA